MAEDRGERAPQGIDTTRPNVSRVYDFMLGGKDNYEADRRMAQLALEVAPDAPEAARANREFLGRVVRFLAAEAGIRQFLDIGSGLPTQGNVHEIARAAAPGTRVVYVDNDPIVLVHGRALLAVDDGSTVVEADLRDPDGIIADPEVRRLIDFDRPVGLLMFAILHHLTDEEGPAGIAARMVDRLAPRQLPGRLPTSTIRAWRTRRCPSRRSRPRRSSTRRWAPARWRTREEILAYFDGLDLLEPGLVPLPEWRPAPTTRPSPASRTTRSSEPSPASPSRGRNPIRVLAPSDYGLFLG
ncbi:SAM-dependent methyltransferase [Nonomuraea rubra]|uniref:SAM-dependent methyltransferase n=1 Tax=Nonomuraea rubra TaxID=46180 RepID=UPI0031F0D499